MEPSAAPQHDLVVETMIVGGGMVGLTLALALDQAGVSVCLIDAAPPASQIAQRYDGRASAIAFASWRMFQALGVAERVGGDVQRIEDIVVSDGRAPDGLRRGGPSLLHLHFDRRELDDAPAGEALGYMVENRRIREALGAAVAARPDMHWLAPAKIGPLQVGPYGVAAQLVGGGRIQAQLAIGADGRDSSIRKAAGIRTISWDYPQTGLVATVRSEKPHQGIAHEFFLPSGPFAILPMTEDRANIVWTERRPAAKALLAMPQSDFAAELHRRFGDFLGALTLEGAPFAYPLSMQIAEEMIATRIALAGDSAHAIHPIAGQGLNMGLRDVAALAECVADSVRVGLEASDFAAMERYQRWRRFDNVTLAGATDAFNRLFSNDSGGVRGLRDLGVAAVGRIGPARRFFMRHAGGGTGALPRLLRGESLAA